jgi:hypothetical protein
VGSWQCHNINIRQTNFGPARLAAAISGSILAEPEACLAGGCRAGLTPRVKILPDEVNAKATLDTDKDGVMLVRGTGSPRSVLRSSQAAGRLASTL